MRFHVLVSTVNRKSVSSRSDEVKSSHSLLCDVTLLSILMENIALDVPQENLLFTNVSNTLFWDFALSSEQENEFLRFWWRQNDVRTNFFSLTMEL